MMAKRTKQLKLLALDDEDLLVISAAMQDAVMKVSDLKFDAAKQQFMCAANRFVWEQKKPFFWRQHERRLSSLAIKRVKNMRYRGIDRTKSDEVLSLLAIRFSKHGEGPEGQIEFMLSGNAGILLDVECIEVQLTDTGAAWATRHQPKHGI